MEKSEDSPAPLTRESLYELVWSEPMVKVADRFKVSSSYMARICKLLNVPRPERGHWAKMAVGKAKPKPPLPEAPPGVSSEIFVGGYEIKLPKKLPRPPSRPRKKRGKSKPERPSQHALIEDARKHFKPGRFEHELGYVRPDKRILIDLAVTDKTLEKALEFANELFLSFEERGHRVVLEGGGSDFRRASFDLREAPSSKHQEYNYDSLWCPYRCTVVFIGTVAIGLKIFETTEQVQVRRVNGKYIRAEDYVPPKRGNDFSWLTTEEYPTGSLRLQAYSPYWRVEWECGWKGSKKKDLGSQVKTIVRTLEKDAVEIARLVEEAEQRAELERQERERIEEQRRREEAERRLLQAHKDSLEHLKQVIDAWGEVNRIEQFFRDAERHAANLESEEQGRILERLKLAWEIIGSIDALEHFRQWRTPAERLKE